MPGPPRILPPLAGRLLVRARYGKGGRTVVVGFSAALIALIGEIGLPSK